MHRMAKFFLFAVIAAMVLLLAGCPQRRTIAEINRDPGAYINKEVTVVGDVSHSFGLIGNGAYELNDGTGSIWILSEGYGVPSSGARVGVSGVVIPTFSYGGKSFANGIKETHRRSHP